MFCSLNRIRSVDLFSLSVYKTKTFHSVVYLFPEYRPFWESRPSVFWQVFVLYPVKIIQPLAWNTVYSVGADRLTCQCLGPGPIWWSRVICARRSCPTWTPSRSTCATMRKLTRRSVPTAARSTSTWPLTSMQVARTKKDFRQFCNYLSEVRYSWHLEHCIHLKRTFCFKKFLILMP